MKYTNHLISNIISRLNLGASRRLRFIILDINDTTLEIINILYKYGAIRAFVLKNDKVWVYYKYYSHKIAIKLSIISKPGNKKYMSLNKLACFYNNNNFAGFYIISTQQGLMTSENCLLKNHIAGEVLIKVEV